MFKKYRPNCEHQENSIFHVFYHSLESNKDTLLKISQKKDIIVNKSVPTKKIPKNSVKGKKRDKIVTLLQIYQYLNICLKY